MKQTAIFSAIIIALAALSGCGPSSRKYSVPERQQMIDNMADQGLQRFYVEKASGRQEIAEAAGYGVFSNTNVYVIVASGGGGYGVAVDKATGRKTYMQMTEGGVGLGLGAKGYQQIVVFKTRQAMIDFVGGGWDFGGQAEATAKNEKSGGGVGGDGSISRNVTIYTMTDKGLALQATVTGSRYWVDDDLNRPGL